MSFEFGRENVANMFPKKKKNNKWILTCKFRHNLIRITMKINVKINEDKDRNMQAKSVNIRII